MFNSFISAESNVSLLEEKQTIPYYESTGTYYLHEDVIKTHFQKEFDEFVEEVKAMSTINKYYINSIIGEDGEFIETPARSVNTEQLLIDAFRSNYVTALNQNQKTGLTTSLVQVIVFMIPYHNGEKQTVKFILSIRDLETGSFMLPHRFWETFAKFRSEDHFSIDNFQGIYKVPAMITNCYGTVIADSFDIGEANFWRIVRANMSSIHSMAECPETWISHEKVLDGAYFTGFFGRCGKGECCHGIFGEKTKCQAHEMYMHFVAKKYTTSYTKKECKHFKLHKFYSGISKTPVVFCSSCTLLEFGEKTDNYTPCTDVARHLYGTPVFVSPEFSVIEKKKEKPVASKPKKCKFGPKCYKRKTTCKFSHD